MLFAFRAPVFLNPKTLPFSRQWVIPAIAVLLTAPLAFPTINAAETVDFRPALQPGSFRQAKAVIEVEGKLKLNADGQEIKHLPLKVHAELQYVERLLTANRQWSEARLARTYRTAEAKIRLHESELTSELRPERRLIAVESKEKESRLYSPSGPL